MSASDDGATLPKPLGEGLLHGEAGNPVVVFQQLLQQAISAMNGQHQHNEATTAGLRNHHETLVTHSGLLTANKSSIEKLTTSVTKNTADISSSKAIIDSNTDAVTSLKKAHDETTKTLKSHKDWQDDYQELQELVASKHDCDILGLQQKYATHELNLAVHDEKLDKQIVALETIGKVADEQNKAIQINRNQTIGNAKAINKLQEDMVIEQEISDERFCCIEKTQNLQNDFIKDMASDFQKLGNIYTTLSKKAAKLNADAKKTTYNESEMDSWLPVALQTRYTARRRKRGQRKRQPTWGGELLVPKVSVPKSYKKAKFADTASGKLVQTAAAGATTRAATHVVVKQKAEMLLLETNKELAAHEEKEETRQQAMRERAEKRQEEENRLQEQQATSLQQEGSQEPQEVDTEDETDQSFIILPPSVIVSPQS